MPVVATAAPRLRGRDGTRVLLSSAELAGWAFAAVLVLARIGSACMVLPGIGEAELPSTVRLGLALTLVVVLLPVLRPELPPMPTSDIQAARAIIIEIAVGLWFGWLTRLWLLALPAAGQTIAGMTGLANVLQPDPSLGPQTAALARAFGLAAPVIILASGLHRLVIEALEQSYDIVPAATALDAGDALAVMVRAVSGSFALSLGLAAPFVVAGIVWQVALAILSRLIPQLQIYFAAMPGQILAGLLMLALLGGGLFTVWEDATRAAFIGLTHA